MAVLTNPTDAPAALEAIGAAMTPQRFLAIWAACLLGALALAAGFNFAVDPYAVFGTGLVPAKPAAIDHPFLAKTYLLERANPATLLVGTSRVDIGLDPASAAWPPDARPVFNLGLAGADLKTLAHFIRHAFAAGHPRHLFVGIGLEDCIVAPPRPGAPLPATDDETGRLTVTVDGGPNPARASARFNDRVTALLSISATIDSLSTLFAGHGSATLPSGFNTAADFSAVTAAEGPAALFTAKVRDKLAALTPWSRAQAFDVTPLATMLTTAQVAGADVNVFIYPYSSEDMAVFRTLAADHTFDLWRAAVTHVVAAARGHGATVKLWDFSGFSAYQTEPLPTSAAHSPLQWYWDPNHFNAALGDLVVARMLGGGDPAFGSELTEATLPVVQARFDAAWPAFESAHPEVLARVAALVR